MKVPSVILFGRSVKSKSTAKKSYDPPSNHINYISPSYLTDTVSFSSTAKYLKKYATLPDSIKRNLEPKDGVDMLKDMELVAQGRIKRGKIEDDTSIVYVNPWLSDYYMMVIKPDCDSTCAFYGEKIVADVIWQDNDNPNIKIIKKSK